MQIGLNLNLKNCSHFNYELETNLIWNVKQNVD